MKIRFGPFTLDLDTRQLTQAGREIHLAPKAFELLATLVLDRPKVALEGGAAGHASGRTPSSKRPICRTSWPRFAKRSAITRARLLYVRTMHGFGYAFCGDATTLSRREGADADRPSCWLEWERAALSSVNRGARHRTRSRCRRQARRVDGLPPSRAARGDDRRHDARRFREQERHVSRQRTRHLADPACRWRCDPHRLAARDLPCARSERCQRTRTRGPHNDPGCRHAHRDRYQDRSL